MNSLAPLIFILTLSISTSTSTNPKLFSLHQNDFKNFQYTEDDYGFFPLAPFNSGGISESSINSNSRLGLEKIIENSVLKNDRINVVNMNDTTEEEIYSVSFTGARLRNAPSADETDDDFVDLEANCNIYRIESKNSCIKDESMSPLRSEKRSKNLFIESITFIYMFLLASLLFVRNTLFH